jgi:hypothetical protein
MTKDRSALRLWNYRKGVHQGIPDSCHRVIPDGHVRQRLSGTTGCLHKSRIVPNGIIVVTVETREIA